MNTINHLIILACLGLLSASCAKSGSETTAPVEQPVESQASTSKPAPEVKVSKPASNKPPKSSAAATGLFRTPSDDISLPTEAQIAEGSEPTETQEPEVQDQSGPSISIQPPARASSPDKP